MPQAGPSPAPPPAGPVPVNPPRSGGGISPTAAAAVGVGAGLIGGFIAGSAIQQYGDVQRQRRQVDGNGFTLYEEPGRSIILENNRYFIRQDESQRFRDLGGDVQTFQQDNTLVTTALRPDGDQIFTITDLHGRLLRRVKRYPDGREIVLIDNTYAGPERSYDELVIVLPPPPLTIARERYIIDADSEPEDVIYETLVAPPVAPLPRRYTLDEVRASPDLRDHMRSVDIKTITFDTASFTVTQDQAARLTKIAQALLLAVQKNPGEMFLIEGYTDAVGSPVDNLSLSDRRAQSVATLLTQNFSVPPENLATQGFGAQNLRVQTQGAARENRRVTVRRITPLLNLPQAQQ